MDATGRRKLTVDNVLIKKSIPSTKGGDVEMSPFFPQQENGRTMRLCPFL